MIKYFSSLLGPPQHTIVLPYLEALCSHDETVVRERAVASISKLAINLSENEINNFIITLVYLLRCLDFKTSFKLNKFYMPRFSDSFNV